MSGYVIDFVNILGIIWALVDWNPQALAILIISQVVFFVVGMFCRSVMWVDHLGRQRVDDEDRSGFIVAAVLKLVFIAVMFYGIYLLFGGSNR